MNQKSKSSRSGKLLGKKRVHRLKNHPFVIPVAVFIMLFFSSLIGIVHVGATTIGPSDARVVHVHVNGDKRTLPTRAETVDDLLKRLDITIHEGDIVEPNKDTAILEDDFTVNVYRARPITIIDENEHKTVLTAHQSSRAIVEEAGIDIHPEDKLDISVPENIAQEGLFSEKLEIQRATTVQVSLYGQEVEIRTHANTVGELLAEKDIEYSEESVFPEPETLLDETEKVFITEVGREIAVAEEEIEPSEEFVDDPNLPSGETEVREEGRPGKRIVVYELNEAGEQIDVLREVVIVNPVNSVVARGTQVVITNPSENVQIGEEMAAERGWTGGEWNCLYQLWQRESGWQTTVGNPVSGAYGIPQSLPGEKMATAGDDWRTNPRTQITWGLGYIEGRFGSPCGAWNFFLANNWY